MRKAASINFHLHALASSLFKGASRYYGAKFGVSLPEMRLLSNLGREGPLAAHQLVAVTAMDKAIVSRVLAALGRRGYVKQSAGTGDPRRRTWELTRSGKHLVERLRPVWREREAIIQAGLTAKEQEQLVGMLIRMFEASERLREQEAGELTAPTRAKPRRKPPPTDDRAPADHP